MEGNSDSVDDCHTNNIGVGEERGEDSMIIRKRDTKSGCVSNQNLEELVEKIQSLQNHVVNDLEDIANNLSVVRDQSSQHLERSISIVRTTAEADMRR